MSSESSATTLTPSQAIRTSSVGVTNGGNKTNIQDKSGESVSAIGKSKRNSCRRPNGRNKQKKGGGNQQNNNSQESQSIATTDGNNPASSESGTGNQNATASAKPKSNQQPRKQNPRNKKKKGAGNNNTKENGATISPAPIENATEAGPKQANQKKRKNNRNRKRYPWRKHIPAGTVDPITLENLASLSYPPFALRAAPPYLPMPQWPPKEEPEKDNDKTAEQKEAEAKERERKLLEEQWGKTVVSKDEDMKPAANQELEESTSVNPKHLNLFDGRALAYYMVSTSQFVDPLNRRDVSREELIHLDRYLVKNGFTDLNVVEAYDTKGVSLSTAGAASTTAAGRMEILQQEARVLLNALFGGQNALPPARNANNNRNNANNNNPLMQQYSNYQASQAQQRPRGSQTNPRSNSTDRFMPGEFPEQGIYADSDGGLVVVDDDLNPSLRGSSQGLRAYQSQPQAQSTLWSANRITDGMSNAAALQPQNFPALSTAATLPPSQSRLNSTAPEFVPPGGSASSSTPAEAPKLLPKKKPLPPAKSLKVIAGAVKKTTAEEAQRQFEAREEARRKAMLSNLTFGQNPASWNYNNALQPPSTLPQPQPTEGQLERNRAFAEALGVAVGQSQTTRTFASWARPTDSRDNVVLYPDDLILSARERMELLAKLERRWKTFLEDDKAASLPLNNMDRESRKLVHEYAAFWRLHTESFDPEPKRYVHCVKLLDTSAPVPLLSEAARLWRGPTGMVASYEHTYQQTAGQDTRGRTPLGLDLPKGPSASNSRALALASERPKLELKERTLPLELPPFQPPAPVHEFESEDLLRRRQARIDEQKRREKEREERKQKALEAAFASDDEEESLGEMDADSDWEEPQPVYAGSDDEEEA